MSFLNSPFGVGHSASDKETLLTRLATEGLGFHHILIFFVFWGGYSNLMSPIEHRGKIYNKMYFLITET